MTRLLAILFVAFLIGASQHAAAQTASSEQTAFYNVMSKAYMDWKNTNNTETARMTSEEIYLNALQWRKSDAVKSLAKPVKKDLKKLVKLSKELDKLAKRTADDEIVKQKLAHVHKVYTDIAAVTGGPTTS
jgi:hypothetical protein